MPRNILVADAHQRPELKRGSVFLILCLTNAVNMQHLGARITEFTIAGILTCARLSSPRVRNPRKTRVAAPQTKLDATSACETLVEAPA